MTKAKRRGENLWIDSDDGFMGAAWYWPPRLSACSTVVILVPGIVHEERTMSGGLVALAEALADAGLPALLMDLHGCSQSAGELEDSDIGVRWRANIQTAVHHARASGAKRVIVIGVRLGVPLAAEALAEEPLAALVAWAPIVSGKRYVRELKMLERATGAEAVAEETIAIGGFSIPASVLKHVSGLDLCDIEILNAPRVMLCDGVESIAAPWLALLGERGVKVEKRPSTQIHSWLFGAALQPELPREDIRALVNWCRALHDEQASATDPAPMPPEPRPTIEFVHQGRLVRETFVVIGPNGLTGVWSEPVDEASGHPVRLLMSTVGPGRTFTDFARDEASRGNISLRFDFAGFGTSGRGDAAQGGELYTDEGARDVQAAVEYLRQAGHPQIYALGFCAGAWSMMQASIASELCAAVAINVALYYQPGPAAETLVKRAKRRLTRLSPLLARNPLLQGVATRVRWTASRRREPIEWLIRMCSADVHVLLAYADLDPGLSYLKDQLARGVREQLRRSFTLLTYTGLGHLAERPSARKLLFHDIVEFFAGLDAEAQSMPAQQTEVRLRDTATELSTQKQTRVGW